MNDPAGKRRRWRTFCREHARVSAEWAARSYSHPPPQHPPFPDDLRGLACGAKTRTGTPCKLTAIYKNGRCKFHGGLSTGPTTAEGKAKAAANGNQAKRKRSP